MKRAKVITTTLSGTIVSHAPDYTSLPPTPDSQALLRRLARPQRFDRHVHTREGFRRRKEHVSLASMVDSSWCDELANYNNDYDYDYYNYYNCVRK